MTKQNNEKYKYIKYLTNRENRIHFLYLSFLLDWKIADLKEAFYEDDFYHFNSQEEECILEIFQKKDDLIKFVEQFLENWSWERINNLEKAIILNASAEIKIFNNKKAIVINESLNYSKKYCAKETHIFINGILDNLSNK